MNFSEDFFEDEVRDGYLVTSKMKIPAPAGYDEILKCQYGDYMKPVKGGTWHEGIYLDPDTPYYITLKNNSDKKEI